MIRAPRWIYAGWVLMLAAIGFVPARAGLEARRVTDSITIDGRLDEPDWAAAMSTADFVGVLNPDGTVSPAAGITQVKVLWDEQTLYFAFLCEGPPGAVSLKDRDALLHAEEVVEAFIDLTGAGLEYVELQVSPAGVVADLSHVWTSPPKYPATRIDPEQRKHLQSDRKWNIAGLAAAVARTGGAGEKLGWVAEISVPVASLQRAGGSFTSLATGHRFRANFVHYRYPLDRTGRPQLGQSSWIPVLKGRPHVSPMAMALVHCAGADAEAPAWNTAWKDASRFLVPDAHRAFSAATDATRESRLGEAVTLLNVQPKTSGNLDRAAQILSGLWGEEPGDEIGTAAAYYLGRIEQVHRPKPNLPRALEHYERLMQDHPGHHFGQLAGLKACMLRLYARDETPAIRLTRAEAQAARFTLPEIRRDYHLMMADAQVRFGEDAARLLAHLLAAEKAGPMHRIARSDLYVRIADAAEKAGRKALAMEYGRKFLEEGTREARVALVRQRLQELEATP